MFSLARTNAIRAFKTSAPRAAAALHTLPDLPYAYNVSEHLCSSEISLTKGKGPGAIHLGRHHETSPPKTSPGLRHWLEHCRRRLS